MTTYDLEILIRTKRTGDAITQTEKEAERARAALKGLGDSANRFDIEISAAGAATQASQRKLRQLGDEVARGKKSVEEATQEWKQYQAAISTGKIPKGLEPPPDSGLKWTELASKLSVAKQAFDTVAAGAKVAYGALKEGAELEAARGRFDNLTATINTTGDALLGKLRDATKGMVSDAELIAGASDIISLGLAKNEGDTVRLATAVSTLGLDMQQVIMTFANNSKARLDSLGLSVEGVTQKAAELQAQGFTGDAFDEAVLIGLEEKMTLLGDASETTAGQLQILESDWKNLTDSLKQEAAAVAGPVVSAIVKNRAASAVLRAEYEAGRLTYLEYQQAVSSLTGTVDGNNAVLSEYGLTLEGNTQEIQRQTSHMARQAEEQARVTAAIEAARAEQTAATQAIIDKANAERDAAHQSELLASQSDQLNEQIDRTAAVADGAADRIAYLAEQEAIAAAEQARMVDAFKAGEGLFEELAAAQDAFDAGQLSGVYDNDSAAAEEAQARITAANEAIKESYRETAAEAILAQNGVNESTLDLLVGIGYLTQEQADARLDFANTTTAIENLTTSQEFAALSAQGQADALNALIDGQANTAQAALATGQAMDEERTKAENLQAGLDGIANNYETEIVVETGDALSNTGNLQAELDEIAGNYEAEIVVETGDALRKIEELRQKMESIQGGQQVQANVGSGGNGGGGRALGGPFTPNQLYRVGEGNLPEIGMLQNSGKLFMIPGERGQVFGSSTAQGMLGGYSDNSQININNYNMQAAAITNALVQERRRARLDDYMGVG